MQRLVFWMELRWLVNKYFEPHQTSNLLLTLGVYCPNSQLSLLSASGAKDNAVVISHISESHIRMSSTSQIRIFSHREVVGKLIGRLLG